MVKLSDLKGEVAIKLSRSAEVYLVQLTEKFGQTPEEYTRALLTALKQDGAFK